MKKSVFVDILIIGFYGDIGMYREILMEILTKKKLIKQKLIKNHENIEKTKKKKNRRRNNTYIKLVLTKKLIYTK